MISGRRSIFIRFGVILAIMCAFFVIAGCGNKKDENYKKGKELILNEKTFDQGAEMLIQFEKKNPKDPRVPEVLLALATAYQSRTKYTDAVATFEKLIKNYPGTSEAYKGMFLMGYMYLEEMKDNEKAKTVLGDFVKAYPDSELTSSAKVLLDNIGIPIENWSVIKEIDKNTGQVKN